MKQYRITTDHLNKDSSDDCVIDPSDPLNELKTVQYLAGLGSSARLHEYNINQGSNISVTGMQNQELEKAHDIKPGTPEWFKLWFSLPYLTGEKKI